MRRANYKNVPPTQSHVAGGKVYGYRNREILGPGGRRDHVERETVPEEAAIIRRMFAEAAQGRGFSRIAKGLNADAVPSPARGRGWATSGVRELLLRELYRGRVIYGKTRWVDKGGTKVKRDVPESEWLVRDDPAASDRPRGPLAGRPRPPGAHAG